MAKITVTWSTRGVGNGAHTYDGCAFHINERAGTLTIVKGTEIIMVYAAGCWQHVADVGALTELRDEMKAAAQQEESSENSRRRQEVRAIPKT
jgi:hypothetical protein